jgi:hypothetical protein
MSDGYFTCNAIRWQEVWLIYCSKGEIILCSECVQCTWTLMSYGSLLSSLSLLATFKIWASFLWY